MGNKEINRPVDFYKNHTPNSGLSAMKENDIQPDKNNTDVDSLTALDAIRDGQEKKIIINGQQWPIDMAERLLVQIAIFDSRPTLNEPESKPFDNKKNIREAAKQIRSMSKPHRAA